MSISISISHGDENLTWKEELQQWETQPSMFDAFPKDIVIDTSKKCVVTVIDGNVGEKWNLFEKYDSMEKTFQDKCRVLRIHRTIRSMMKTVTFRFHFLTAESSVVHFLKISSISIRQSCFCIRCGCIEPRPAKLIDRIHSIVRCTYCISFWQWIQ